MSQCVVKTGRNVYAFKLGWYKDAKELQAMTTTTVDDDRSNRMEPLRSLLCRNGRRTMGNEEVNVNVGGRQYPLKKVVGGREDMWNV